MPNLTTPVPDPEDAPHEAFAAALTELVDHPQFPCVGAKAAFHQRNATVRLYDTLGTEPAAAALGDDLADFVAAVRRVADGGTALDPQVVAQLLLRRDSDPLARLTPREREVLGLMAEGRSNAGIAQALVVSESAVAKHINNIFAKLDLPVVDADHRRVLAVLRFLGASRA